MSSDDEQRGRLSAKVERLEQDMNEVRVEAKNAVTAVANIRTIITAISIIVAAVWANPRQVIAFLRSIFP